MPRRAACTTSRHGYVEKSPAFGNVSEGVGDARVGLHRRVRMHVVSAVEMIEQGHGHAPGLPHGGVAAGQAYGLEMPRAAEVARGAHEELASPDGAVGTQTRSVERYADHGALVAGVGQDGGHMRLVVLHGDQGKIVLPGVLARETRGEVVRM